MPKQWWQQTMVRQIAAGTLFNTYTTSKTVINPQALWVMPAGFLDLGDRLYVRIKGAISNIVTTPGTLTLELKFGSIIAFTTGPMQLNATAHTTLPFWSEIELSCRTVGDAAVATVMGQAMVSGRMVTATAGQVDDAQGMPTLIAPATAPAVGAGFNSTIANVVDLWAGFSISNAGNGIQIHQYAVESL